MKNSLVSACIGLCCLTCIGHHGELQAMQPQPQWVLNNTTSIKIRAEQGKVKFTFTKEDRKEHPEFFRKLEDNGILRYMTEEGTVDVSYFKTFVKTLRFDIFQAALKQESVEFQEKLRDIANGDIIRIENLYYRLADYGIFRFVEYRSADDVRQLYSSMMELPHITLPNGEVHVRKDSFDVLFDLNERFESLLYCVKPRNYLVFDRVEADNGDHEHNDVRVIYVD